VYLLYPSILQHHGGALHRFSGALLRTARGLGFWRYVLVKATTLHESCLLIFVSAVFSTLLALNLAFIPASCLSISSAMLLLASVFPVNPLELASSSPHHGLNTSSSFLARRNQLCRLYKAVRSDAPVDCPADFVLPPIAPVTTINQSRCPTLLRKFFRGQITTPETLSFSHHRAYGTNSE